MTTEINAYACFEKFVLNHKEEYDLKLNTDNKPFKTHLYLHHFIKLRFHDNEDLNHLYNILKKEIGNNWRQLDAFQESFKKEHDNIDTDIVINICELLDYLYNKHETNRDMFVTIEERSKKTDTAQLLEEYFEDYSNEYERDSVIRVGSQEEIGLQISMIYDIAWEKTSSEIEDNSSSHEEQTPIESDNSKEPLVSEKFVTEDNNKERTLIDKLINGIKSIGQTLASVLNKIFDALGINKAYQKIRSYLKHNNIPDTKIEDFSASADTLTLNSSPSSYLE